MPLFPLSLARERGSMGCSGHIFPNDKAAMVLESILAWQSMVHIRCEARV
jgi:hypothetical protein